MTDPARLLTADEVAERCRCSPRDVKTAWKAGRLSGVKFSTGLAFRAEAVTAWIEGEERRCRGSVAATSGSGKSEGATSGTSTGMTPTPSASAVKELALESALSLRR